ncbi:MAG: GNAT family N-acetyltransferase [Caulobacterales bacterium]
MSAHSKRVIAPVTIGDSRALARLHAMAFPGDAWTKTTIEGLFGMAGVGGLLATGAEGPRGFILIRRVADEAEILTLAVHLKSRRQGIGAILLTAAMEQLRADQVDVLHLEVGADNLAAIALYEAQNFMRSGLRRGYYQRAEGLVDAVLMQRPLQA